jgi:hypothetical protein
MITKEEYYENIKKVRAALKNPENLKCTCPKLKCEWHGNCKKCVAQHRFFKSHIPTCMQAVFNEKIKDMVQIFELNATEKEKNPEEYWDYVRERDNEEKSKPEE